MIPASGGAFVCRFLPKDLSIGARIDSRQTWSADGRNSKRRGSDMQRPACGQCLQRASASTNTCPGYGAGWTFAITKGLWVATNDRGAFASETLRPLKYNQQQQQQHSLDSVITSALSTWPGNTRLQEPIMEAWVNSSWLSSMPFGRLAP